MYFCILTMPMATTGKSCFFLASSFKAFNSSTSHPFRECSKCSWNKHLLRSYAWKSSKSNTTIQKNKIQLKYRQRCTNFQWIRPILKLICYETFSINSWIIKIKLICSESLTIGQEGVETPFASCILGRSRRSTLSWIDSKINH